MNAYDIWGCGPVAFNPESEPIWLKGVQDSRGSSILWSSELTEFEKKPNQSVQRLTLLTV